MTLRTAVPGLAAGGLGLVAGFAGLAVDAPVLAAVAGGLALAAGLASVVLARHLDDQLNLHAIVEHELRTERARLGATGPLFAADPDPVRPAGPAPTAGSASSAGNGTGTGTSAHGTGEGAANGHDAGRSMAAGPGEPPPAPAPGAEGPPTVDVTRLSLDVTNPTGPPAPAGPPVSGGDADGDEPDGEAALVDRATGLFSETFFRVALESRIAAARRHLRPIAVVLLEVVEGLPAGEPVPVEAGVVSTAVKSTLREADTSCRLRNGYFALLLEDTPENGAIWTVERIRRGLADTQAGLTVWAGVACYPAHAFTPDEILGAAERALVAAREWRQDRIEVAVAAD